MRNLKKVLVMVLALAMMLSIMVVGAGAVPEALTDFDKIDDAHKEAVEMATQLNIIEGFPDKSFQPQGDVTRAQIAKMICKAINAGEEPATSVKATPSYNDIKGHWAEGFIEYCTAKGIIAGYPDGSFKPEQPVTGAEAAKMMLVALGYNADVENYVGDDWDLYVNVQANQDGLYVNLLDVADLTTANLSREHTAQMVWNMLQAYSIKQTSSIDRSTGAVTQNYAKSNETMFWDSYRGVFTDGVLQGFKHTDGKFTYYIELSKYYVRDESGLTVSSANGKTQIEVKSANDYTDWLGQTIKVAFNADDRNATFKASNKDAYGIFHSDGSVLAEALFGDLATLSPNDDTLAIGGKTFRMDNLDNGSTVSTLPVYAFTNAAEDSAANNFTNIPFNSATPNLYDIAGRGNPTTRYNRYVDDHQKFQAVDQDGDGKIDFLMVVPYSVAQVSAVNGTKVNLNVYSAPGVSTANKQFLEDVAAYDGVQRHDWVVYTAAKNTVNASSILEKANTISGTITKANNRLPYDSALATIDGTQYTFSYPFDENMGTTSELDKVGNTLNNAVVVNNYIFAVDNVKKAAITDFALVTKLGAADKDGDWAKMLFYNSKSAQTVSTVATSLYDPTGFWYVDVNGNKVYDAVDVREGTLVTFSRNADGDYILSKVVNTADTTTPTVYSNGVAYGYDALFINHDANGYKVDWNVTGAEKKSNSSLKAGYLYGTQKYLDNSGNVISKAGQKATINDDAVIFVRYRQYDTAGVFTGYGYKVISGNQLTMNEAEHIKQPGNAEINSVILGSTYNNVNHVELAYVDVNTGVEDSATLYGYITDFGTEGSDRLGTTVKSVDLWTVDKDGNGTVEHKLFAGTITVYNAYGNRMSNTDSQYSYLDKGMVLQYKLNEYGEISEIIGFYDVDNFYTYNGVDNLKTGTTAATVALTDLNRLTFSVNGNDWDGVNTSSNGYQYFNVDTMIKMCVDNTMMTGQNVADPLYTATRVRGNLVPNAFVIYETRTGEVELIVTDFDMEITESRPVTNPPA